MEYTFEQHLEQTILDAAEMLKSKKITFSEYKSTIADVKKAFGNKLIQGKFIEHENGGLKKVIFEESELKAIPIKRR